MEIYLNLLLMFTLLGQLYSRGTKKQYSWGLGIVGLGMKGGEIAKSGDWQHSRANTNVQLDLLNLSPCGFIYVFSAQEPAMKNGEFVHLDGAQDF